jgi:threonine dehydrogenase-like Zn-dependent dehydrogenase
MKHTYTLAVKHMENNLIDVRSLVTHRFPLEMAGKAFSMAARR